MEKSMLSQEEIDALLGINSFDPEGPEGEEGLEEAPPEVNYALPDEEKDALGEIANISMGTAATTLSSLINKKVNITTPVVNVTNWDKLGGLYERPCVAIQVKYKEGLIGTNLLILKEEDVKIITDLMMGGDGLNINQDEQLSDLHLSAICEAMNQMIGSSSTSMFSIFNKKIDILPPHAQVIDFDMKELPNNLDAEFKAFLEGEFVQISFDMEIGDVTNSVMMQLYPIEFARGLYQNLVGEEDMQNQGSTQETVIPQQSNQVPVQQDMIQQGNNPMPQQNYQPQMSIPTGNYGQQNVQRNVQAQPVQFQNFQDSPVSVTPQNIDLLMDVPLEVSVELGRTKRSIKEILDFAPGTVIELDKLAGDPIDILVNGKLVAKGEVVVIDEHFAISVTDIINKKINL